MRDPVCGVLRLPMAQPVQPRAFPWCRAEEKSFLGLFKVPKIVLRHFLFHREGHGCCAHDGFHGVVLLGQPPTVCAPDFCLLRAGYFVLKFAVQWVFFSFNLIL